MKVAIFILFLLFVGCEDFFSLRDVELPSAAGGSAWSELLDPEDVLENFKNSIGSRNVNMYLCMFENGEENRYIFEADEQTKQNQPSLREWGYSQESGFITNFFSYLPFDSLARVEFEIEMSVIQDKRAEYGLNYFLQANHTISDVPQVASGYATLHLLRSDDDTWKIHYWRDEQTNDGIVTWSEIKAGF